jgi:hypothetical protein
MWPDIVRRLPQFPSAVLSGVDGSGYPVSVRCTPQPDGAAQVLRLALPAGLDLQPGPAWLLCHRHDERLWNLKAFAVPGRLEQDAAGWLLRPRRFLPGIGIGGLWSYVRYLVDARRNAHRYLERRGLPRPKIPWDELTAMLERAQRNQSLTDQ